VVHKSLLVILDRLREACAGGTATSSDFQHATSSLLQLYNSDLSEVRREAGDVCDVGDVDDVVALGDVGDAGDVDNVGDVMWPLCAQTE
jgi:hypothetical protein